MVTPLKFLLLLLFSVGTVWAAPTLIGNAHYKSGQPLINPVNDATDIARKLRELGFTKVVLGIDMDKRAMRKSLREFRDALRPGDVALAYYAGHGVMVGGVNYMVPIDAKLEDEDDVKDDALPMDDLLKTME
ncbi:caspase family protein, partial [bacterium]|nr:caspase family protein [bacterium]